MVSGAILGGAGEVDVDRLRKYSRSIGLAFQVGGPGKRAVKAVLLCLLAEGEVCVPFWAAC